LQCRLTQCFTLYIVIFLHFISPLKDWAKILLQMKHNFEYL
jgi:hypothetical protein